MTRSLFAVFKEKKAQFDKRAEKKFVAKITKKKKREIQSAINRRPKLIAASKNIGEGLPPASKV